MCSINVKIANVIINIIYINNQVVDFFKDFIVSGKSKYNIVITQNDIDEEKKKSKVNYSNHYVEKVVILRKVLEVLINDGIYLFHSSSILYNDKGYAFIGPSGIGKSSHVKYLNEIFGKKLIYINDDKPLIKREENKFILYGSPWKGKHKLGNNVKGELNKIFIVNQGIENSFRKLDFHESLPLVYQQFYIPKDITATTNVLKLVKKLCQEIEIYSLICTNSIDAAEMSKKLL